jgi:hypothetical protein
LQTADVHQTHSDLLNVFKAFISPDSETDKTHLSSRTLNAHHIHNAEIKTYGDAFRYFLLQEDVIVFGMKVVLPSLH